MGISSRGYWKSSRIQRRRTLGDEFECYSGERLELCCGEQVALSSKFIRSSVFQNHRNEEAMKAKVKMLNQVQKSSYSRHVDGRRTGGCGGPIPDFFRRWPTLQRIIKCTARWLKNEYT